jgi:hypothetical protein
VTEAEYAQAVPCQHGDRLFADAALASGLHVREAGEGDESVMAEPVATAPYGLGRARADPPRRAEPRDDLIPTEDIGASPAGRWAWNCA